MVDDVTWVGELVSWNEVKRFGFGTRLMEQLGG